jgi:hypothetical protein
VGEVKSPTPALFGGCRVQRIEIAHDIAVLQLRLPGETWLVVLSCRQTARGVGVVGAGGRARARALLGAGRTRQGGAGLLGLNDGGVWLSRDDRVTHIGVDDAPGGALVERQRASVEGTLAAATDLEAWLERGAALLDRLEGSSLQAARQALLARIDREADRLARRVKAVEGDLDRGRTAQVEAEAARLFVALAARAPRGTTSLTAIDWSSGEAVTREMKLHPARRPQDQVEAIFARGRRLKRGAVVAQARMDEARLKRSRLLALREAAEAAPCLEDLARACDAVHRRDPALLPGLGRVAEGPARPQGRQTTATRRPYRTFLSASGARLLVGRGAADNDDLTLHVARPCDLWLHVKESPGAHVVVPLARGRDAPADLLVDAAHLAAHFSDARGEAVVAVTYAQKRHVRKPRGSPPGRVQVGREKVLILRVDPARLAALLAREEEG